MSGAYEEWFSGRIAAAKEIQSGVILKSEYEMRGTPGAVLPSHEPVLFAVPARTIVGRAVIANEQERARASERRPCSAVDSG